MNLFLRSATGLFLLSFVFLTSCKKDEGVTGPDRMVGTYSFEGRIIDGFGTLPAGTCTVTKIAGDKIRIAFPIDSTNLPVYTVDYLVNDVNFTEIETDSFKIPHPFLSRLIPTGKVINYHRHSKGVLSGSYLVIDGGFITDHSNAPFQSNSIAYKIIGFRLK